MVHTHSHLHSSDTVLLCGVINSGGTINVVRHTPFAVIKMCGIEIKHNIRFVAVGIHTRERR